MTGETPAAAADWIAFLRRLIDDDRHIARAAMDGGWWEPTGPGIAVDGRIMAQVSTGSGLQAGHEVVLHMAGNQPVRVLDELDAKERLLDLCEHQGERLEPALLAVLVQFAALFHDHPDHPENTWEET
ncbi:DUF6221 family protein [Streptomyces sp. NPDC059979]|uniref:DUF6221 family protein n=1 Tax=Streptomyces sp. NPDC059979 TaxID=3347021 RepID=UPI0036AA63B5